jgi:hypothetical protein
MLMNKDPQSLLRRVWIVYRVRLISVAGIVPVILLSFTDYNRIVPVYLAVYLFAGGVYSLFHSKRAAARIRPDLRRKGLSAARIMNISLFVACADLTLVMLFGIFVREPGPIGNVIGIIMALAFPCILMAGQLLAARRLHAGALVLWLRRFHGKPHRGVTFPAVLGMACAGLATPITLQDEQFSRSAELGTYRSLRTFMITLFAIPIVGLLLGLLLYLPLVLLDASPAVVGPTLLVPIMVLGVGVNVWLIRHRRKLGVFPFTQRNLDAALPAFLHGLRTKSSRVAGLGGVVVMKVPDESWRAAVLMTLEQTALAIIDLTDPTDNLAWELRAASKKLPLDRIIVACARTDQKSEESSREFIRQTLTQVLGSELVSRIRVLFYPEGLGKSRLFVPHKEFVAEMHTILQDTFTEQSLSETSPPLQR